MTSSDEEVLQDVPEMEEEDDLFGEESEKEVEQEKPRELDDEELDSGDDEGRNDRVAEEPEEEQQDYTTRNANVMDAVIYRHTVPKPMDGEINLLRIPKFLALEPEAYDPDTFEIPTTDHHSTTRSANFSANAVAMSTTRRRIAPSGQLESNTNVHRWSDGSVTVSIGDQHYELQTKPLAPPRGAKPYNEVLDSHTYLASPSLSTQICVMIGHLNKEYTVRPNQNVEDDALERLQKRMKEAASGKNGTARGPEILTETQEDPEAIRRRAEHAERERMKLQRRRENQEIKQAANAGGRRTTVDDLGASRGKRKSPSSRRPARRSDYDSDDEPQGRRNREDEYDMDDGFLASSDEDLEEEGGEDDDEEEILEDSDDGRRAKKQKTSKPAEDSDADADAEADLDDEEAPRAAPAEPTNRRKRNIIEDDEDDE